MTTERPLERYKGLELEALIELHAADDAYLEVVECELNERPRSRKLLDMVREARMKLQQGRRGATAFPIKPLSGCNLTPSKPSTVQARVPQQELALATPAPAAPKPALAPPGPPLSRDDAYALLQATAGTCWAKIEQTRQRLVLAAHPGKLEQLSPEKAETAKAAARRVNAAYALLSVIHCQ